MRTKQGGIHPSYHGNVFPVSLAPFVPRHNDMWGIVRKVFTSCMQIVLMDKWGSTLFPYLFVNFANCANIAQMGVIPICVVVCKLQSVLKQAFAIPKNVLFWLMGILPHDFPVAKKIENKNTHFPSLTYVRKAASDASLLEVVILSTIVSDEHVPRSGVRNLHVRTFPQRGAFRNVNGGLPSPLLSTPNLSRSQVQTTQSIHSAQSNFVHE